MKMKDMASRHLTTVFKGSVGAGISETKQLQERQGVKEHGMQHKVWFDQGVSGIGFQGMADQGELVGNSFGEQERGKEFCLVGVFLVKSFLFFLFKAVDSSAKHSLSIIYAHYRIIE
jgi:hypothetical protein